MSNVEVLCEIAPEAKIHPDAHVGRWCVVGPHVEIGAGTKLTGQVTVLGRTILGRDNVVGPGSVIGGEPQDLKYRGGATWLLIGDRNRIGRNVTVNVGTELGGWVTYVGDDNILRDACHIAHDCYVASGVSLGHKVLLAGHIVVQRGAVIEDMTGIHHFVRIGRHARVGARTPVRRDVPPFVHYFSRDYYWDPPQVRGVHEAGLAAAGLDEAAEADLRAALAELFDDPAAMATTLDALDARPHAPVVEHLCRFCRESLAGSFGRFREGFRGRIPPEADEYLPERLLEIIRKEEAACR